MHLDSLGEEHGPVFRADLEVQSIEVHLGFA